MQVLDTVDSKELVKWSAWIVLFATLAIPLVFITYFFTFPSTMSDRQEIWGQFGDYIGGTLNPILSFLALIALVLTLALQSRQLELTKMEVANSQKELEATREELKKSSAAQELTARALSEQTEYAAISARLAAQGAALSVVSEMLRQYQGTAVSGAELWNYQLLVARKNEIANNILKITDAFSI